MGLYDRDYGREEEKPSWGGGGGWSPGPSNTPWDRIQNPRSITNTLIIINVAIFFADMIFAVREGRNSISHLAPWMATSHETLVKPWLWWQFLSYGFVHDINGINHILFNMFGLFIFGRTVEQQIGRFEFLKVYLLSIIIGGVIGSAAFWLRGFATGTPVMGSVIGASGGVVATCILFACRNPHATILLFFVIPMKAATAALLFVGLDLAGALGIIGSGSRTAFEVHLAGAAFAALYHFKHWNFRWIDLESFGAIPQKLRQRSRRMKLKIHDPDKKLRQEAQEADRILAKIHQSGESSLTSSERKILERYSRRQRQKRNS